MKMIKILNWILSILGGIILIVLIILILPWNLNKADAEETAPPPAATMDTVPETEAPTMPPAPDTVLLKDASVGDYVFFGHYEQDNNEENGKEAIEWLVLDRQGEDLLLISLYGLDCQLYHADRGWAASHSQNRTVFAYWSMCTLRPWLNEEFLQAAFSEEEQERILLTKVAAIENPFYHALPGADTEDKVFLLSFDEADMYFASNGERICWPTEYAKEKGSNAPCWWWLRTSGNSASFAVCIGDLGDTYFEGLSVDAADCAVRPAVWVRTGE